MRLTVEMETPNACSYMFVAIDRATRWVFVQICSISDLAIRRDATFSRDRWFAMLSITMRIVGNPALYREKPNPQEAWRRGAQLNRAVARTQPTVPDDKPWPTVERLSHKQMNEQDDARMLARARILHAQPPTRAAAPTVP